MKIFKENSQSLLPRPILVQGRPHLALGVLLFFDLTAPAGPESLLTEQELWKTVPPALGPDGILDQGMPKLRGEYLVAGSCCAPRDTTLQAAEVLVRVGELEKRLSVFGERFWTPDGRITPPRPFASLPLTWDKAFGGPHVPQNPVGQGAPPPKEESETPTPPPLTPRPLPQVENPAALVGTAWDSPEPWGLAPWDMAWPQRNMHSGTFDERWKRERWPGLPEDFDFNFFNAAPLDQRLPGFFQGDEALEISGMHPDYQLLQSALPGIRVRCFLTLRQGFQRFTDPTAFPEEFREVQLHPETLWLFPTLLRGVLLYRGGLEVADEDYGDVVRIFLANESLTEAPLSLEHYRDAQLKALDRGVPMDLAPFAAAQAKIAEAVLKLKNMPKEAARAKQAALGKLPVMPREPAELAGQFHGVLAANLNTLDRLEALAGSMNQRWGHIARINTKVFAATRAKIEALGPKIDADAAKLAALKQKGAATKAAMLAENKRMLQANLSPQQLAAAGVDPDNLLRKKAVEPWPEQAFAFAVQCRRNLEQDAALQSRLQRLGFNRQTLRRAWLGWNPTPLAPAATAWGLPGPAPLDLPVGLVLPFFDGPVCVRLCICPAESGQEDAALAQGGQERSVLGSNPAPRHLPAAVPGAPMAVVADEFQALLLEQELGDCCDILALPGPLAAPEAAAVLEAAAHVAVLLPQGSTADGPLWQAWLKVLPLAIPVPLPRGATLFAARLAGVDLRRTVLDALPPDFARRHALAPELPEAGATPKAGSAFVLPFPQLNIGGLVTGVMQELKALHQPKIDALQASKAATLDKIRTHFAAQGLDPERALAAAEKAPRPSPAQIGDDMAKQLLAKGDAYRSAGHITEVQHGEISRQAAQIRELAQRSQARLDSQKAMFAQMQQKAAGLKASAQAHTLPGPAGAEMAALGLTPENAAPILTREQFLARQASGLGFARKVIKGVDCSELDLREIDLHKAVLDGVNFTRADLRGARFSNAVAQNLDCSEARLDDARLEGALFRKCVFAKASLQGIACRRASFKDSDFGQADLSGAAMRLMQADKCLFKACNLAGADLSLMVLMDCDLTKASFRDAKLHKVVLRNCLCDDAVFAGAELPQSSFQASHGARVSLAGANLDRVRIISGSAFPGLDLRHSTLRRAYCRDSDLSDALFEGADLRTAIFEGCTLHRARLDFVVAKEARFTKCDLEAASLRGVNLAQGSLRMSRLVQADLSGANLFGVDFYKAVVGKTQLRLATLTRTLLAHRTDLLS